MSCGNGEQSRSGFVGREQAAAHDQFDRYGLESPAGGGGQARYQQERVAGADCQGGASAQFGPEECALGGILDQLIAAIRSQLELHNHQVDQLSRQLELLEGLRGQGVDEE